MTATLKKCCYGSCPPDGFSYNPCDIVFKITFTWEGPCRDLDTAVVYDGASSGYDCDNGDNPRLVSGDITGEGGTETHWVKIPPFDTGYENIELYMHWHEPAFTSSNCPVSISITNCDGLNEFTYCAVEDNKYVGCSAESSANKVGTISVKPDSTFDVFQNDVTVVEGFCLPKSFDIEISGPVAESSRFTRNLLASSPDQFLEWHGADTWTGQRRQLTSNLDNTLIPMLRYIQGFDRVIFYGPHIIMPLLEPEWYHLDMSVLRQPLTISVVLSETEGTPALPGGTYTYTFTPIF